MIAAVQFAVSASLLAWAISRADVRAAADLARRVDPVLWAAGAALVVAGPLVAALRTRELLAAAGRGAAWRSLVAVNLESTFFSIVLPGDVAGGVVRWARLRGGAGSGGRALGIILVERIADWFSLGVLACAGAATLFDGPGAPAARAVVAVAGAALALAAVASLLVARSRALPGRLRAAAARRAPGLVARALDAAHDAVESIATATRDRRLAARIAWTSLAYWGVAWTGAVLLARAVSPGIPPLAFVGAAAAVAVVSQLPVTIAGLGLREASLPVLLAGHGVTRETGLLLGLSLFAPNLVVGVAGGVLHLLGRTSLDGDQPVPPDSRSTSS